MEVRWITNFWIGPESGNLKPTHLMLIACDIADYYGHVLNLRKQIAVVPTQVGKRFWRSSVR
jgi:hypothetical protein